jgi:hypothetical protein
MIKALFRMVALLSVAFKQRRESALENLALHHQLAVFNRNHKRLRLRRMEKDAPTRRAIQNANRGPVSEVSEVGGLHHHYERRAAWSAGFLSRKSPITLQSFVHPRCPRPRTESLIYSEDWIFTMPPAVQPAGSRPITAVYDFGKRH